MRSIDGEVESSSGSRSGCPSYNLSVTFGDSSPSRGASGETVHFAGTAKASPTRRGGTPSGVTERLYKGKPAHNQKSPRHDAERAGGLFVQSGGMRKRSALGVS